MAVFIAPFPKMSPSGEWTFKKSLFIKGFCKFGQEKDGQIGQKMLYFRGLLRLREEVIRSIGMACFAPLRGLEADLSATGPSEGGRRGRRSDSDGGRINRNIFLFIY